MLFVQIIVNGGCVLAGAPGRMAARIPPVPRNTGNPAAAAARPIACDEAGFRWADGHPQGLEAAMTD